MGLLWTCHTAQRKDRFPLWRFSPCLHCEGMKGCVLISGSTVRAKAPSLAHEQDGRFKAFEALLFELPMCFKSLTSISQEQSVFLQPGHESKIVDFFFFGFSLKIKKSPLGWDQEWKISGHKSNFSHICSGQGNDEAFSWEAVCLTSLVPCVSPLSGFLNKRFLHASSTVECAECRSMCEIGYRQPNKRPRRRWLKLSCTFYRSDFST